MKPNNEQNLREFIAAWGSGYDGVVAAYRKYLADDIIWDQSPLAVTRTLDEATALLADFRDKVGLAMFPADVLALVVRGEVGFAERIDHLTKEDGVVLASFPVTGVFRFDAEGKIVYWREYFDSAPVVRAMAG
ncbi:MAG: limonene-1,2-epoxide hydrolase family protein [Porticoccaceae bacterium]